jgi:hypothetical protein
MKLKNKLISCGIALSAALSMSACTGLLEEQPRATYTPDFFSTTNGVENGISSLYYDLRGLHGTDYVSFSQLGTDETTYGSLGTQNNHINPDLTDGKSTPITPSNDDASLVWVSSFSSINNANGIIQNGQAAGIAASLLAEANFFRAYRYFLLVTTFGGVPLDLGAGELAFNTSPTTISVRNTVPEVYTKAIFPDLLYCIANLPESPRLAGTSSVTKNVARLFLSKAYLTYAWWLENPNDVPTYPETARTDPDGKSADQYFQLAYDTALAGINNPGPYGLMPTFFEAHLAANDRNKEMMFYADYLQNAQYGSIGLSYHAVNASQNYRFYFFLPQFDLVRDNEDPRNRKQPILRMASQEYGRPWTRLVPPSEVLLNTFADKTNDSRYETTFVTTMFGNWEKGGKTEASMKIANGMDVPVGGAVLKFLPEDLDPGVVTYQTGPGTSNISAGEMAGESAYVYEPSRINRHIYPGLWKINVQRTDNGDGQGGYNGSSPRPIKLGMFSEFYLLAAEAAVKGASGSMSARELVNVIRERAGKWVHKNSESIYSVTGPNYIADFSAEMVAATPAEITLDYVLMERSREYYGEGYRWYDLTRTQKWEEYGSVYHVADQNMHDNKEWRRTITKKHYLRPIPQLQIDAMDENHREGFQNPGW